MKLRKIAILLLVLITASLACSTNTGTDLLPTSASTNEDKLEFPTPVIATPTLNPYAGLGSEIEAQADGYTRYTDLELRYQVFFDSFWVVIPMDKELQAELYGAIEETVSEELQPLVETEEEETDIALMAFDKTLAFSTESTTSNIIVAYEEDASISQENMHAIVEENADMVPNEIRNAAVSGQAVRTNAKGIEYGYFVIRYPDSTFGYPCKQAMAIFKMDRGLVVLTFTSHDAMFASAEPFFMMVVDSYEKLN